MNGPHDMGGAAGFGPAKPEPNEPAFHAEWERRVFALTLAMGPVGRWNIDQSRSARERTPDYLSKTYFQIWLAGLEMLTIERGLVSGAEIETGHAEGAARPVERILTADNVSATLARGGPTVRPSIGQPAFAIGQRVRARQIDPPGHTRLPRYVRGHVGVVTLNHGCHVFADTHAAGEGEAPQWLYTVRFDAHDLWGEAANPADSVSVDAWQSYLEAP
ncbi:MAG: nitrile hydratase subunit beta [Alphaproteobacteria bacterium]